MKLAIDVWMPDSFCLKITLRLESDIIFRIQLWLGYRNYEPEAANGRTDHISNPIGSAI
jgi:hypothetical protein